MQLSSLKPDEFKQHISNTIHLVIDVRQPEEWEQNHISGAKLIPLSTLPKEIHKHGADPKNPIYVYCQHGVRSHQAGLLLLSLGYEQIYHLEGGLSQWINAGFPCQSGPF